MPPQLPGFDISVLRQRTAAGRQEPVLISGRVSALGVGLPAFVRVFLEGPRHNPETRTFDSFASPLSGDYSVQVLAEKDGQYEVFAQAFPPLGVPVPGAPQPLFLGPPLAESSHPPLAIGRLVAGQVEQELAPGQLLRVPPPPPTQVEVSVPITFAPRIEVTAPDRRVAAPPAPAPAPPAAPEAPAEVAVTPQLGGRITGFEVEQ